MTGSPAFASSFGCCEYGGFRDGWFQYHRCIIDRWAGQSIGRTRREQMKYYSQCNN
ncbi:MAG TPA: hypothetical protein VIP53_02915 [Nitrososphaera sp.]